MAKNSIRDFDATSGNNTDIQSVDISEGCAASGINNALRELMTDLKNVSTGAVNLETPGADQLNVDNIRIDGNTISSTDTNGDITLDPNGTGKVAVPAAIEATTSTHANASVFKSTGNTQLFLQDTDATANDQFWGFQVSGGSLNILTCDDDRSGGFFTPIEITQAGAFNHSVSASGDIAKFVTSANGGTGLFINSQTAGQIDLVGYNGSAANNVNIRGGGATNSGLVVGTGGDIFVGQTSTITPGSGNTTHGTCLQDGGRLFLSADGVFSLSLNRSDSGELTNFHRAGVFKGSINITTSGVSYNTSSDARLKDNIVDMTGAIDRVKQLAPKRFNFIEDADNTVDGFLAHEAQAVVPEAVTGTKDEVDDDGNAVMQGIDQSKLVPLLTGALQEAIAKIEALETEMTALKARVTALEA